MELYIIALKELGVDNNTLCLLLNTLNLSDFTDIFKGRYIDIQFKYSLDLNKYSSKLSNLTSLSNSLLKAEDIIKNSKKNKIKILLITNKRYPQNLKSIDNPPVVLYYKGKGFFKKHEKSIACVGTRNPSEFSYSAINSLIPKLVEEGFSIISGLAEGVDVYSHKVCLNNNGITIAVLAHGLDMIYPKFNESVASQILDSNGLLVSEYPIGTKPDKFRFVDRNRIVSGLSKSVIVFETKEKSGTMHTVNYALSQNKNIFCPLPGSRTVLTSQLYNLIESKVANPLISRSSYDKVVYGSGYKIKKDSKSIIKYKSNILSSSINNSNVSNSTLYNEFNKTFDYKKTSFNLREDLSIKLDHFVKTKNISKKDLFNAFVISLLDNEDKL